MHAQSKFALNGNREQKKCKLPAEVCICSIASKDKTSFKINHLLEAGPVSSEPEFAYYSLYQGNLQEIL